MTAWSATEADCAACAVAEAKAAARSALARVGSLCTRTVPMTHGRGDASGRPGQPHAHADAKSRLGFGHAIDGREQSEG